MNLKQVDLTIYTATRFYYLLETNTTIEAGDPCKGDSGGPLLIKNTEDFQWTLIATLLGGGLTCEQDQTVLYDEIMEEEDENVDVVSDWNKVMPHMAWIKSLIDLSEGRIQAGPIQKN